MPTLAGLNELGDPLKLLGLALCLIVVAFLVNRFAPDRRRHIKRTVVLYGLFATFVVAEALFAGLPGWGPRFKFLSSLFEAFTFVSLVGLFVFDALLPRLKVELASIVSDISIGLAYIATTIGVAHAAGWNLSSVIATSAVVSGILAISLQATLGNILGGVALQLDGSIHVGDWIQLESGRQGKVKQIRWRHTLLETRDWATLVVPNSALLAGNILILGKRDGEPLQARMWVNFCVDFKHAPQRVVQVVEDALAAAPIPNVAARPKPSCVCMDFTREGYAAYAVRYHLTDLAVDDPTNSVVRARIYAALNRAGIHLARPARSIVVTNDDETRATRRFEKDRSVRAEALARMELFQSLTETERLSISERLLDAHFVAGEVVTRQGAVAHWLYILVAGTVEIRTRAADGSNRTVARLEAPSFFGEMGLMNGEPRAADVVALTDVTCYRLDKSSFEHVVQDRPEVALEMSAMLARRRSELMSVRADEPVDGDRQSRDALEILGKVRSFFGLSE